MTKVWRFALIALAACSDTTTGTVDQLNLDRPVDISFACFGGLRITNGGGGTDADPLTTSAQPLSSCEFRSGPRGADGAEPRPPGQQDIGDSKVGGAWWYAFILQSGPGTVAVARFDTKPSLSFGGRDVTVLDSSSLTPGKNSISVGEDPIAIATDRVGCYEVIANAGSCDLSTLEVKSAVEAAEGGGGVVPLVSRLEVKNAAGEVLRARPAAMAFEPPGGTIGVECPAQPTGLAYIAYPSCHMVAGVDVETGTIVTSITFDANGVPMLGDGNVSCPAECDGAAITPGVRPVALDLERDERTGRIVLAIGADNSNVLHAYELDTTTHLPLSLITPVELEDPSGRLGVTSVSVTPMIGMGGEGGNLIDDGAPGGDHQFIYAIATDASVRVVDITGAPHECDTQIDPRYLRDVRDVSRLACLPVGDPTLPRRQGVRGPGIQLPGGAMPTGVDVARVNRIDPTDARTPPRRLIGYFGLISSADGRVYVFNVDDDDFADWVDTDAPLATPIPLDIPHQLRDAVTDRGLLAETGVCNDPGPDPNAPNGNTGGPRIDGSPTNVLPADTLAPEKTGGLPSIRQVLCEGIEGDMDHPPRPVNELFFSAPIDVRDSVFPDIMGMSSSETWTLTWEGPLSRDTANTSIDGPAVRTSQLFVDGAGMHLVDKSRPFCDAGVEPYDIVQLRGCDPTLGDAGCPAGYTCYVHPQSQVTGIGSCMLIDEAERFSNACKPFLTSLRRYTVGKTKSGELQLLPRKTALRTTPLQGCDTDEQCEALADYAVQNASSLLPGDPNLPTDPKTWRCLPDPDRKPTATGKRCLLVCDLAKENADCAFGTVCQANSALPDGMGFCMEGVTPPQACVNAPQRYELRAGEAFAVLGSQQGYIHPIVADAGDVCVRDPNANPLQVGRIPLDPPACDPDADPVTGRKPDGTFGPNPCKTTVQETEYQLNYVPGTCTLGEPDENLVTRDATGIVFRNRAMNLTLVDPTYQGDLMCHGDRQGTLENVPLVAPGFQLSFRLTAGFTPLAIAGIAPALPIKVVRGPTQSFWVIDEGDYLSTSISQASTRGKVYRIESTTINTVNIVQ